MRGGNERRSSGVTELERARAVNILRAAADEGKISARELDERLEIVYRSSSKDEVDGLLSDLGTVRPMSADAILALALAPPAPKGDREWRRGQLAIGAVWLIFWVVVWALTGGGLIWLVLLVGASAAGLALRLARGPARRTGRASLRR